MTDRVVLHSSFTLERSYPRSPTQVFAAWADPASKARWFGARAEQHELDFRVGGQETTRGRDAEGRALTHESRYHDIVEGERLVYTSTLWVAGTPATVSLTTVQFQPTATGNTVQFQPTATGTTLLLTEQAAHLDGHEEPEWRESGTSDWLAALGRELASHP
jgi:uncharacterized protein YndB with AHSA1/START domain